MPSPVVIAVAIVALVYAALRARIHFTQHADEPPVVLADIPFLGPILGVLRKRYKIYTHLLHQYKLPIYTLRVPFAKVYIVSEPSLVPAIERLSRVIAFQPIEAAASANLLGMSEATNETLQRDPTGDDGHFVTFHHAVRPGLAPGPGLDVMNRRAVDSLAASLAGWRSRRSAVVPLLEWVQHEIIMATTDAEYGPGNPFRDPEFERMWYTFESGVRFMSTKAFPQLLAPAGLRAREFLAARFRRYFAEGHDAGASAFLHARQAHGVRRGMTPDDRARGELGVCLAMVNNTVAAAFWMVYHLFSDPALLAACRAELEQGVRVTRSDEDDTDVHTIDLDHVKFHCPLLLSTLQEVFRYRGIGTLIIRRVLADTRIAGGRWLLRKGAFLLIPNSVQHFDPRVWGADAAAFDARRFLKTNSSTRKRAMPSAFRVYGSGSTLCPGRHFADTEILAFAALMVLQFNVRPTQGPDLEKGRWTPPPTDGSLGLEVARLFIMPQRDVEVEVRARAPAAKQRWRVVLSESQRAVQTVVEDIEALEKRMRSGEEGETRRRESV